MKEEWEGCANRVEMRVCVCVFVGVYMHVCAYTYVCVCSRAYARARLLARMCGIDHASEEECELSQVW